jgi:hypothetical protein
MTKIFLLLSTLIFINATFAQKIISAKIDTSTKYNSTTYNKNLKQSSKFTIDVPGKLPMLATLQLRNCSKEMRVVTFNSQLNFFKRWAYGLGKFDNQKVLFFSPNYKIDSNYLNENFKKIRGTLPKNFGTLMEREEWYDIEPNQDSIWFIQMFGQIDKNGFFKIYSAYKITFEGTDARVDLQRVKPKIKDIEFIFDKQALQLLDKKLKHSSKVH